MRRGTLSSPILERKADVRARLLTALALVALCTVATGTQDARAVLQTVSRNIGADNLTTLQFSGTSGWSSFAGASYSPDDDWTRFEVSKYVKTIDFGARYLREQTTRGFGNYPRLGGAQGVPAQGENTLDVVMNGDSVWTREGGGGPLEREGYMDGIPIVEMRRLDILLTPHGFVKAALAPGANPTMVASRPHGRPVTFVTIMSGKYRITAAINDRNEIEHIQTHVANPMLGDMLYEVVYGPYRQFGAVKFPSSLRHNEGDPRVNAGHGALEVQISDVQANAPVEVLPVPEEAKKPPMNQATIASETIGEGIWYIGGIRHGSVLVEFRDFLAVVEAPLNEKRAIAVINEVYRLVPNKPIRYLVNTHHHFDHSGGMRTFVAEGATIVTHQRNREFYEKAVFSAAPRTLEPDRLSLLNPIDTRAAVIETVDKKYVITDGTRELHVVPMGWMTHVSTMVVAHLPRERMAIFADSNPKEVLRLGFEPGIFVSLHGGVVKPN
jgi:glyoxylase-like metal-dependent hydrolase (beta-lactamase superfamily II)